MKRPKRKSWFHSAKPAGNIKIQSDLVITPTDYREVILDKAPCVGPTISLENLIATILARIADLKERIERHQNCLALDPSDEHHAFMIAQYRSQIIKHLKEIAHAKDTRATEAESPKA